jgi:hypothetical protein
LTINNPGRRSDAARLLAKRRYQRPFPIYGPHASEAPGFCETVQHEWQRRLTAVVPGAAAEYCRILIYKQTRGHNSARAGGGGGYRKFASRHTFKNIFERRPTPPRPEDLTSSLKEITHFLY